MAHAEIPHSIITNGFTEWIARYFRKRQRKKKRSKHKKGRDWLRATEKLVNNKHHDCRLLLPRDLI